MKTKLIGSHDNLESLRLKICNYFYSPIDFIEINESKWFVANAKGPIKGFFVVLKHDRYRFEMMVEK